MKIESSYLLKHLIVFNGKQNDKYSCMITKVYGDNNIENLVIDMKNIQTVRGPLDSNNQLIANSSMSGPHHYFGSINPKKNHIILQNNDNSIYCELSDNDKNYGSHDINVIQVPKEYYFSLYKYYWINGKSLNLQNQNQQDSLFPNNGILEVNNDIIEIPLLLNAYDYDLSEFRASFVKNNNPWSYNQELVSKYKHAQHEIHIVTFYYGNNYVNDYLLKQSGVFIETHDFVQSITPMNKQCSGFIVLGKINNNRLDLIAFNIPFGYTLLINPGCIHGDSTLTGLYQFTIPSNLEGMDTADTVFIKNKNTKQNVNITTNPPMTPIESKDNLLLTSNIKSKQELQNHKKILLQEINTLFPNESNPILISQ